MTRTRLAARRDFGPRGDRQQTRLMWLLDSMGVEAFTDKIAEYMGPGTALAPAVHEHHTQPWPRRDVMGVHPQKQAGLCWVGAVVPSGRLQVRDARWEGSQPAIRRRRCRRWRCGHVGGAQHVQSMACIHLKE